MNADIFTKAIENLKTDLNTGLLSSTIWDKKNGLSITSYNPNDKYTALFSNIANNIEKSLNNLGFPPFGEYQIIDLEMDTLILIANINNEYLWGSIIDKSQVTLGFLLNIALPNALKNFK